jgi:hypothetical protein
MRVRVHNYMVACGCRSVGECSHNSFAEFKALDALVDQFAAAMKSKLRRAAVEKGKDGWDDPKWTPDDIKAALLAHVEKGDAVDVANFAAFLWNRQ